MPTLRSHKGFTLLELLVAITIFAIVSILAMSGYNQLVHQREIAATTMERVRNVQRCVMRMSQDLEQLVARPIRDATSATDIPALVAGDNGADVLEFTRAGWSNPTGINRSTMQRVRYRFVDNKLYRDYWSTLDRTLNTVPVEVQMLDKVTAITFRYMDSMRQWQTTWPPTAASASNGARAALVPRDLPVAVEVTLTLQDWGEIKRVIEVPSLL
jgi:general secretion pathway protein J